MNDAKPAARDDMPAPDAVTLTCTDGMHLRGHFFPSRISASQGLPVLLAPATGVRQHFYFRFADWLASQGHAVLVFDYRGIGLSRQGPLSKCPATLVDWARLDQTAALNWLLTHSGTSQVVLLGHSAGGQMIGLLADHHRIARLVGVSASTGWFSGMRPGFGKH